MVILKALIGVILIYLLIDSMATEIAYSPTGRPQRDMSKFLSRLRKGYWKQGLILLFLFFWLWWVLS